MKGFPFNFPFIILRSVGSVIVPETGSVYPLPANGNIPEFDEDEAVHVSECTEEWMKSLRWEESEIVNVILNK